MVKKKYGLKVEIKVFDCHRHYGYINSKTANDVHFQQDDVVGKKCLKEGQKVEFDLILKEGQRSKAENIKIID